MNWIVLIAVLLTVYPFLLVGVGALYVYRDRTIYARQHDIAMRGGADGNGRKTVTIGIFHPYANCGGGGERVLYCALIALVAHFKKMATEKKGKNIHDYRLRIVLYAGDDGLSVSELIDRAAERFNLPDLKKLNVDVHVQLVHLIDREVLDPSRYPRFTLLWQSIAHIRLALDAFEASEALGLYPRYWIDTTGCAFSYLIASIRYGCKVVAYVHYPMISTDMIEKVQKRLGGFNNQADITTSSSRSLAKYIYYRMFAVLYSFVGKYCTDIVMVNSTWTYNHIKQLWKKEPIILYPPCGSMEEFMKINIETRSNQALSIAQFRPEKNQLLQLQALKMLLDKHPNEMKKMYGEFKLVMLGSCRNADDEARVGELRKQATQLGVSERVDFVINASFDKLKQCLATSSIGLHTMYNEHFGISVVEMMAAGVIVVANNSGGPAADIVKPGTGFLALTAEEYADKMFEILQLEATKVLEIRTVCRTSSHRFSDDEFGSQFLAAMASILPQLED